MTKRRPVKAQLVDPSAFTPPYDRALAAALARAGADVELLTSRFLHGPVPEIEGYRVEERFYRRSAARGLDARGRRPFKAAEHVGDLLRFRRDAGRGWRGDSSPDVVHYQWLTMPPLDVHLLPPTRPRLLTAHYILPPRPRAHQVRAARSVFSRFDAVVAHSEHSATRLREEVGLDPGRVHVIPHGAFDYLPRLPTERPLPPGLAGTGPESTGSHTLDADAKGSPDLRSTFAGEEHQDDARDTGDRPPVILFFGLLRPYKGLDVLLEAFRQVEGAELWIVGNPRMDVAPLRRAATAAPGRVRFLTRFVEDAEIPAIFRRADVVVLPYRDAEHSGVLYTALAFGKPLVLSAVGGFPEVAELGAARLVPPGDPGNLAVALADLTADETARDEMAAAATAAATGPFSWDEVARQTLALYEELLGR